MCRIQKFWIIALLLLSFTGCYESDVMHGLSEREANSLISRLNDSGIEAEKLAEGKDTWSIRVNQSFASRAIKIISRGHSIGNESAEEQQSGLFLSREDRKFYLARSLAQDIEQTLVVLSGVHEAKVHLKFPDEDPFLAGIADNSSDHSANAGSASALIIVENESLYKKEEIAKLVSGASGIPAERISVWLTIDKIGKENEKSIVKSGDTIARELNSPVSKAIKSEVVTDAGNPRSGFLEPIRNLRVNEIIGYIQNRAALFLGSVLIGMAIIIFIRMRMKQLKDIPEVIPSYIP